MSNMRRRRVLHIVGGMNVGGVETWLMHVLRHRDNQRLAMDFLVHTREPCFYDEEIRARGSKIIPCLDPKRPFRYGGNLISALKSNGPYDVLHSHVHHFSGFTLTLARFAGVPVRVAHSHLDSAEADGAGGALRRMYFTVMKRLIRNSATSFLAASHQAGEALFGSYWRSDERSQILLYGIDIKPFRNGADPKSVRNTLGLPEQAFVVGHVAAFRRQKNHDFLMDICSEFLKKDPRSYLLLVGDGPLRPSMEQKAVNLGLKGKVVFAGVRSDVPDLMKGAMDVFVMPSLYEGLGLVCVEAQAAGLPLIISERIPSEADVVPELVERISLSEPATVWADRILKAKGRRLSEGKGADLVGESPFSISENMRKLESVYGCNGR